jgi:hypothetical protein
MSSYNTLIVNDPIFLFTLCAEQLLFSGLLDLSQRHVRYYQSISIGCGNHESFIVLHARFIITFVQSVGLLWLPCWLRLFIFLNDYWNLWLAWLWLYLGGC